MAKLDVLIDLKSPYAYLAIEPSRALARQTGAALRWRPYILDIPAYLGSAEVDDEGNVLASDRTEHNWRRVRYAYRDVRRYANLAGLTIRGTKKIWDTRLWGAAMLWLEAHAPERTDAFLDHVFPPFWNRAFDAEDVAAIRAALADIGAPVTGFDDYAGGEGERVLAGLMDTFHEAGYFGVPTYVLEDGEFFWGREHIDLIRQRLS